RPVTPEVAGSSPVTRAIFFKFAGSKVQLSFGWSAQR
ncbi:MAG: hypothetical protein K0S21_3465, partial [Rhizobiaceae bacterium]|nr:hypothetical protein [Rhizobiaceae bacterium]